MPKWKIHIRHPWTHFIFVLSLKLKFNWCNWPEIDPFNFHCQRSGHRQKKMCVRQIDHLTVAITPSARHHLANVLYDHFVLSFRNRSHSLHFHCSTVPFFFLIGFHNRNNKRKTKKKEKNITNVDHDIAFWVLLGLKANNQFLQMFSKRTVEQLD